MSKRSQKDALIKNYTGKSTCEVTVWILWKQVPPEMLPGIWENMCRMPEIGHFKAVCKSRKAREVNDIEQIENQDKAEEDI